MWRRRRVDSEVYPEHGLADQATQVGSHVTVHVVCLCWAGGHAGYSVNARMPCDDAQAQTGDEDGHGTRLFAYDQRLIHYTQIILNVFYMRNTANTINCIKV